MVLEDSDRDGTADSSHVFVQDTELIAPLGISVFDNKIVVVQPASIVVYTDVDRNLKFDPKIDTREELLTGFNGRNHDHSLPPETQLPSPSEIAKLSGNISSGKLHATRCMMCHKIGNQGVDYGPSLKNWITNQGLESFLMAVIFPTHSIAHGYTGSTIFLKEGGQIDGLLYSESDPVSIMSTGGIQQMVPRSRIKNIRRRNKTSLMLSADQLGFTAQELADLAAFMVNLDKTSNQVAPESGLFE